MFIIHVFTLYGAHYEWPDERKAGKRERPSRIFVLRLTKHCSVDRKVDRVIPIFPQG